MRHRALIVSLALVVAACGGGEAEKPETIRLLAHDSFASGVDEETFAGFTEETGVGVEVVSGGDTGSMVNQAALSAGNPIADVMFGVDDTFLSRAIEEGVFVEYRSGLLDQVRDELVPENELVTPIDFGDVCLNYDKEWFEAEGMPLPVTLDDLRSPDYAGLLTVEHPATSSPGLAFLFATVAEYGEEGWRGFWTQLREGGVNVTPDWDTAYYAEFTRYGGDTPLVVSYASSPPAEVIFADPPVEEAPTGVIEEGCYRQVEFAGVLAGTEYPETAGDLIDFMLTVEFQERIPLTWFVFPANADAELPPEFVEYTVIPSDPARLDPDVIAESRDRWIDEWVAIMEG